MILFTELIICAGLIIIVSHFISQDGQRVAGIMNWHEGFVGVLFLAAATSLPELFVGISSVAVNKVNLGFSDAIGSLVINMMIIGILDYFQGHGRILLHARKENVLTAAGTVILLAVLGFFSVLRQYHLVNLCIFGVGIESMLIIGLYLWGMRIIFKNSVFESEKPFDRAAPLFIWIRFILLFAGIALAGIWLVNIGGRIAESTHLHQSFIGALVLAFATSLPELAVSMAALRLGSIDMAIANILGSNLFDVCIPSFMDIIYRKGPLLGSISPVNIFTIILAIVMTGVVIAGLLVRSKDTHMKLTWDTGILLFLGTLGYYFLYKLS